MTSFAQELQRGIDEKIYQDAELLVAQNGVVTIHESAGEHATQPNAVFDLASLTKPLCTATLCMILTDQKKFLVNDTVDKFFSTQNLKGVTLTELLNHTSGLTWWNSLYTDCLKDPTSHQKNLAHMTDRILNDPTLMKNPRGTTEYSCLGYILLTAIVEKIGGAPLNELFDNLSAQSDPTDKLFFSPNGQRSTVNGQRVRPSFPKQRPPNVPIVVRKILSKKPMSSTRGSRPLSGPCQSSVGRSIRLISIATFPPQHSSQPKTSSFFGWRA